MCLPHHCGTTVLARCFIGRACEGRAGIQVFCGLSKSFSISGFANTLFVVAAAAVLPKNSGRLTRVYGTKRDEEKGSHRPGVRHRRSLWHCGGLLAVA